MAVVELSPLTGIKVVVSGKEEVGKVTRDFSNFIVLLSGEDVEDTVLSGVGVVVLETEEVILLLAGEVEPTALAGKLAVINSDVVGFGETAKCAVEIE